MSLKQISNSVKISSISAFIAQQSDIKNKKFVFSYQITICNQSEHTVQLLSRHWVIQDANGKVEEIYGEGVIGEQPTLSPGQSFTYNSGAILETEIGTMEGRYFFTTNLDDQSLNENYSDKKFEALIPKFTLAIPRTLH